MTERPPVADRQPGGEYLVKAVRYGEPKEYRFTSRKEALDFVLLPEDEEGWPVCAVKALVTPSGYTYEGRRLIELALAFARW